MSSLLQIEANRRNARKSTGPRSAGGKAISSRNSLQCGIDAQSAVIRGESAADLERLARFYYKQFRPVTILEQFYVDILIRNHWQLRRLDRVDAESWEYRLKRRTRKLPGADLGRAWNNGSQAFVHLQQCKSDIQCSTVQARRELLELQGGRPPVPPPQPVESEAAGSQIGFVAQPAPPGPYVQEPDAAHRMAARSTVVQPRDHSIGFTRRGIVCVLHPNTAQNC
jgi:hypothetical protein